MQVKHAIILAAGKGTRMGEIGKILAKPLWPFFGHNLLGLQIKFLHDKFGIERFFVNTHHLAEQFSSFNSEKISIVFEPNLLDQGGGILNITKKFNLWDTPLLINNADQFYFFDREIFMKGLGKLEEASVVLFGLKVKKTEGYNELIINSKDTLEGIKKNEDVSSVGFDTYSGMALIKVEKQEYQNEALPLFKSIGNFEEKTVLVQKVEESEYYDFGKLSTYFDLCINTKKIIEKNNSNKVTELIGVDGINYCLSYGLNFRSDKKIKSDKKIVLDQGEIWSDGTNLSEKINIK